MTSQKHEKILNDTIQAREDTQWQFTSRSRYSRTRYKHEKIIKVQAREDTQGQITRTMRCSRTMYKHDEILKEKVQVR